MKVIYKFSILLIFNLICFLLNANGHIDSLLDYNYQCFKKQVIQNDFNIINNQPEENNYIYVFQGEYSHSNSLMGSVDDQGLDAAFREDLGEINQYIKNFYTENGDSVEIYGLVLMGSKISWNGLNTLAGLRSQNEVLNDLKQMAVNKINEMQDPTGIHYSIDELESLFNAWQLRCYKFLQERKILSYQLESSDFKSYLVEVEELTSIILDPLTNEEQKDQLYYFKIKSTDEQNDNLLFTNLFHRINNSTLIFNNSDFDIINNLDAMISHLIFLLKGQSDFWDSYDNTVSNEELDTYLKTEPLLATRIVSGDKRKLAFSNLLKALEPEGHLNSNIFYDFSINKLLALATYNVDDARDYLDLIDQCNSGTEQQGIKSLYYKFDVTSMEEGEGDEAIDEIDSSKMAFVLTIIKLLDLSNRLEISENTLEWYLDHYDNVVPLESDLFTFRNANSVIQELGQIDFFGYTSINYNEVIPVNIEGTFTIGNNYFTSGSIINMPAIQAALYSDINDQVVTSKAEWLAADIGLCLVGVGELKIFFTAGNFIKKTLVLSDILSSGIGIYAQIAKEENISPKLRAQINIASLLFSLPNILTSLPKIGKTIDDLDNLLDAKMISQNNLVDISVKCNSMAKSAIKKMGNTDEFAESFADEILAINKMDCDFICKLETFGCFTKGTTIMTNIRNKEISTLNVGDSVFSYNHKINKKELKPISFLKRQVVAAIMMLVMTTGDTLWATVDHPFYSAGRYVAAKDLKAGDQLFSYGSQDVYLLKSFKKDTSVEVYNLTVPDNENYYVGSGILVHNACFLEQLDGYPTLKANLNNLPDELKGKFIEDFVGASDETLIVLNGENGVKAWEKLSSHPQLRIDHNVLKSFSKSLKDEYLSTLNLEQVINNKWVQFGFGCPTCTSGSKPWINELIDYLDNFQKFKNIEGYGIVLNQLINSGKTQAIGSHWVMKFTKQNNLAPSRFEDFINEESGEFSADIIANGKFIECKSWGGKPPGMSNVPNQMINYFNTQTSLSQFEFRFDPYRWVPTSMDLNQALKSKDYLFKTDRDSWDGYLAMTNSNYDDIPLGDLNSLIDHITSPSIMSQIINP